MSSVWITGLGAVTCLGGTAADLWRATLENRTGIAGGIGPVADRFVTPEFNDNRALAFAVRASGEAMAQAGWDELRPDDGLILATTTGLFLQWDRAFTEFVAGRMEREVFRRDFLHQPIGELTKFLARELGHRGPSTLLTSACSASTQALALGALWIRQGRARRCLVVGVEVLCDLTREGFRSLQLLSDERAKPFDRHRGGINLSEGAAALCLDTDGARALAGLAGSGLSTDAFHMTGPQPGGQGSERAMRQALRQAGIGARDVEWVHAHGTGSMANDLAEGCAIARLCGEYRPWVSSTKWVHGHALAASGALEAVLIAQAMRAGVIPRTRGLEQPDAGIPVRHPAKDMPYRGGAVLKNTLGFGGTNASLVFTAATR